MYVKYLSALNELNNVVIKLNGSDEIGKFSLSDERWAKDKFISRINTKFAKGEIYQFDFGKNFPPEMSYEHRGLIIGVNKKLLYVLPIFSYNANDPSHKNAYHPLDNPDEKQDYYLMKSSEFNFIKHDSVLKLNDMRTISVNRKIYQHTGRLNINDNTYKKIEDLVIQKYFNQFHYEFTNLKKENANLKAELEALKASLKR